MTAADPSPTPETAPPGQPGGHQRARPEPLQLAGHCHVPEVAPPQLPAGTDPARVSAILVFGEKWLNGTELRYTFLDTEPAWVGTDADKDVVRGAFERWKEAGIGLAFLEVADARESEIRIGFDHTDGSWSYVGRQVLSRPQTELTMNFGWTLEGWDYGFDTALHEIGHTLGLPHEHQNPNAGIEWDEDAVYRYFGGPPNSWPRATTHHNILRKLNADMVRGSDWDRDSIMHYQFPEGLITAPDEFHTAPLVPSPNLSDDDVAWILRFYPPLEPQLAELRPFESQRLQLKPGQQVDYLVRPEATATSTIQTFGKADTVLGLFEQVDEGLRFRAGDDDSGTDLNAAITAKLYAGRRYIVRLRLYWAWASGQTAIMMT